MVSLLIVSLGRNEISRISDLAFDAYQRALPRMAGEPAVVIVDIDEASIAQLGQWPWPRATIAQMVDRLGEMGAASIGFDVVFPEPDRLSLAQAARELQNLGASVTLPADSVSLDGDAQLAAAFARNPVVSGIAITNETDATLPTPKAGFAFGGADPKTYLLPFKGGISNLAPLGDAAVGMGFFSFPPTRDNIVRTIPLVALAQGQLYPALSIESLRVAQGAGSFAIRSTGASGEADTGEAAMTMLRAGALDIPTGPLGEFWVYFSGLPQMRTISAEDLLKPDAVTQLGPDVEGRIVLVGTSAVGLRDLVATPVASVMPGVRVHAEIIDQIIGQSFLVRPDWAPGAEILVAAVAGLILVFLAAQAGPLVTTGGFVVLAGLIAGASWWAFATQRLLLDPIGPVLPIVAIFAVTMPLLLVLTSREKLFVRNAFGRYLSPSLVERLADNPAALELGGEIRELTVLFSDIRGFTAMSEKLDPKALTALLNSFLTPMTDVLLKREATIDKYIGDAIMAFWNAPLDIAAHPRKACLAALEMAGAVERLNRETGSDIRIGIGLNTGPACVGNLGSSQRFSYSAIGDSVNLASRVESLTKFYGLAIAVTEHTRKEATDLAFLEADRVRVVGRTKPVALYALLGDADLSATDAFKAHQLDHEAFWSNYTGGSFGAAVESLARARSHGWAGFEKLYDLYAERLAVLIEGPVPDGWDGTFTAQSK
ncbi:adenylate/guanylate cyclase domain-containing protein [Devosia sp. BK]|uniref:CHASE2 domain-containing protein n=1 Tax=Devosia sp. BK TaxID=2871706 RepID=UPI00293AB71D|nr:adenylate/guanylate cyclase domain-containing protein [Devosia sp. BK]MDV3252676.1 adenylate/guanylate cyclase domain-containing protein [Devosia sp. BK]